MTILRSTPTDDIILLYRQVIRVLYSTIIYYCPLYVRFSYALSIRDDRLIALPLNHPPGRPNGSFFFILPRAAVHNIYGVQSSQYNITHYDVSTGLCAECL